MALFDRDERSAASVADLTARDQFGFYRCTILGRFHNAGFQRDRTVDRSRAEQLYMKIGGNGTRSLGLTAFLHKVISRGPVGMTIEQSTDDPAIQDAGKRLMMRLSMPFGDKLVAIGKGVYMEPFLIRWPAAEADAVGRKLLL